MTSLMGRSVTEWSVMAQSDQQDLLTTQAQLYMGLCYYWGFGITKNTRECSRLISLASTSNNELSNLAKGICYFGGFGGVTADMHKALSIFQTYADGGNALAQHELGLCYKYGYGVTVDSNKAQALFSSALAKGLTPARNHM